MTDALTCSAGGCGGRLNVLETRTFGQDKRRRRRCVLCGETYTTIESVLREGEHNASVMTQSHRLLDRLMLLAPANRQAVEAVIEALEISERRAIARPPVPADLPMEGARA